MIFYKTLITLLFATLSALAQTQDIDTLLEKVNQAPNAQEKQELIEKLKKELAQQNKEAREKADAILKAKEKMPTHLYNEKLPQQ